MSRSNEMAIAPPGSRPVWEVLGERITCRISSEQTSGSLSAVEIRSLPDNGPPMHVHHREDEMFYVVDGVFELTCGTRVERAEPGALAFMPRGVRHTYRNAGREPGTLIVTIVPGGFEGFFREVNELSVTGTLNPASIATLGKRYALDFVGSPGG